MEYMKPNNKSRKYNKKNRNNDDHISKNKK